MPTERWRCSHGNLVPRPANEQGDDLGRCSCSLRWQSGFCPSHWWKVCLPSDPQYIWSKNKLTLEDWVTLWMGSCYVHWNQSYVNRWVKCILFREPYYLNRFLLLLSGKSSVFFINIPGWLLQDVIVNLANNTVYIILSGSVSEPHYLFYMELRET